MKYNESWTFTGRHVPDEHGYSDVEGSSKPLENPLKIKIKS